MGVAPPHHPTVHTTQKTQPSFPGAGGIQDSEMKSWKVSETSEICEFKFEPAKDGGSYICGIGHGATQLSMFARAQGVLSKHTCCEAPLSCKLHRPGGLHYVPDNSKIIWQAAHLMRAHHFFHLDECLVLQAVYASLRPLADSAW